MTAEIKNSAEIQQIFTGRGKQFVIVSHTNPDGDALGSGLVLQKYLQKLGHIAHFILPDMYPSFLEWMPGTADLIIHDQSKNKIPIILGEADYIIFVDLNAVNRIESLEEIVNSFLPKVPCILFDHHIQPDELFSYKFWDIAASSTSELIYDFIIDSGHQHLLDKEMAECIYTGIMTDTGSFSYSCNSPKTYRVLAHLFDLGIDGAEIHQFVYNTFSEERMRLMGYGLSEKLKVFKKAGGAYIALDAYDLVKYKFKTGDTEGLVNYTLSINGIHFGALLTQMEKYIKISFRSTGDIDVNAIARRYFQGGGHKNASGAYFYGTLEEACLLLEYVIKRKLK